MTGKRWLPEDDKLLRKEYRMGVPAAQIAEQLGRSLYATQKRASRLGLRVPPRKKWDIPHGTLRGYSYYKCRCDLCRAANAEAQREYQRKRREDNA